MDESQQILVFVKDGSPISFAITNRSEGDLINYSDTYYMLDEILVNSKENGVSECWVVSRFD